MTIWLVLKLMILEFWNWKKEQRAIVFVKYGNMVKAYPGKRAFQHEGGDEYHYRGNVLIVPEDTPWDWLGAHRMLGVEDGKVIARPFEGGERPAEGLTYISDFCRGNSTVKLNKSFRQAMDFNIKWLLVVAVVGVACYFGYTQFLAPEAVSGPGAPVPTMPGTL